MEQHQVPQHIASYEFRLVGDMTLKQFLQVAGGAGVALIFYASGLPGIIKWPAILISGLIGAAFAFLPLEDRPLSIWIIAFFRSIYSPTLYKKAASLPQEIFAPEAQEVKLSEVAIATPLGEEAAQNYLNSLPREPEIKELEKKEENFLIRILSLVPRPTQVLKPTEQIGTEPPRPRIVVEEQKPEIQAPPAIPVATPPKVEPPPPQNPHPVLPIERMYTPWGTFSPSTPSPTPLPSKQAHFTQTAAPPIIPQGFNVVVGQVVDEQGNPIESAILEIRDEAGRPVRALRTNKVGHFLTATPLLSGNYQIITEKDGFDFDPIGLTAAGQTIAPVEIIGKAG